ncbi:hypothetical protein N8897_02535, partial [Candidatus Pelagibacter sp.]|nr:hypothetical protein [Candidatus Pelagibacter sp.]
MNIYIFIEIKRRELSARLLLALEAANRGHEVYMGDISPFLKRNLFNPGIIHHKSLTPKKNRIKDMINLNKKSFVFTSQDEETGLINPAKDYLNSRYGASTLKLVKKVFTWGKFDLENLMKRYPQFKKKFFNTGNPRTDFWKAKNKNFYDKNIVKYKDYILISSNFETICSYMNLPVTLNLLRDLGYFQRGMTEEQIINKATKEQIIFEKFVALIKKISLKFPKKKIIFRPHPIEKVQYWKIIFEKYKKNIVVDNSNEIGYWITNCSHVIHNGCTGGMEAAL